MDNGNVDLDVGAMGLDTGNMNIDSKTMDFECGVIYFVAKTVEKLLVKPQVLKTNYHRWSHAFCDHYLDHEKGLNQGHNSNLWKWSDLIDVMVYI